MISTRASNVDFTQQEATGPKVERTIPDVSEKVPTDLKEIKVVFNERMTGVDVAYCETPVGEVRWEDNDTTHIISLYKALGIPAQFVTYEDTGHEIKPEMIDDITAFFKANAGDAVVEIVPHQYSSEA